MKEIELKALRYQYINNPVIKTLQKELYRFYQIAIPVAINNGVLIYDKLSTKYIDRILQQITDYTAAKYGYLLTN